MSPRSINILGVTGSIGQSTAKVILSAPENFNVQVVTAHSNVNSLADMARKLRAQKAVIADEGCFHTLKEALSGSGIDVAAGQAALLEAAAMPADLTMAAIMGIAGLEPLMAAIPNSKAVALANKEPLVACGPLVMRALKEYGTQLLPVDSEHNAIFQVFDSNQHSRIEKIILTASGGPFLRWTPSQMESATPAQALKHPNWEMGKKISIDSATLMNKALEVIEAHYLFDMPPEKIEVLIHPQSIIHSMVEYCDGSVLAQLGANDMCTPIAYSVGWPDRLKSPGQRLDLTQIGRLEFEPVDTDQFPALPLAYEGLRKGASTLLSLNAANEASVDAFLDHRINFSDIININREMMENASSAPVSSVSDAILLHKDVLRRVTDYIQQNQKQKTVTIA